MKDWIDGTKEGTALITAIFTTASKNMWRRLLLMTTIGLAGMGGVTLYNFIQVKEFSENTSSYLAEVDQAYSTGWNQKVLDHIDLCISALKAREANKSYYCQEAVNLYKETFVELPNNRVAENIKRSAYGAMRVDMQVRMRAGNANAQLDNKRPKLDEISGFLITPQGLILLCAALTVLMLATAIATFIIARRTSSKAPATSGTAEQISNHSARKADQAEQHQSNDLELDAHSA